MNVAVLKMIYSFLMLENIYSFLQQLHWLIAALWLLAVGQLQQQMPAAAFCSAGGFGGPYKHMMNITYFEIC